MFLLSQVHSSSQDTMCLPSHYSSWHFFWYHPLKKSIWRVQKLHETKINQTIVLFSLHGNRTIVWYIFHCMEICRYILWWCYIFILVFHWMSNIFRLYCFFILNFTCCLWKLYLSKLFLFRIIRNNNLTYVYTPKAGSSHNINEDCLRADFTNHLKRKLKSPWVVGHPFYVYAGTCFSIPSRTSWFSHK